MHKTNNLIAEPRPQQKNTRKKPSISQGTPSRARPQSAETSTSPTQIDKLKPEKDERMGLVLSPLFSHPDRNQDSQTFTRNPIHAYHILMQDTKRNHAYRCPTSKCARAVTGGGAAWRRPDPITPSLSWSFGSDWFVAVKALALALPHA